MEISLENAFVLMIIGMTTVMVILTLLIIASKVLIYSVNKWIPAPQPTRTISDPSLPSDRDEIETVINEVVARITGGKGIIKSIKER